MDIQTIAVLCAGAGLVSTIVYHIVNFKKLRAMRDIRDRLDKKS